MSLTSVICQPEVKKEFSQYFIKPALVAKLPMLAPPKTTHYRIIGTAFDYLLRFYIGRINQIPKYCKWVAEIAIENIPVGTSLFKVAKKSLSKAHKAYNRYQKDGVITEELLEGVIYLAKLDIVFRVGVEKVTEEDFQVVDPLDLDDLNRLLSIVPQELFIARNRCQLNPTFMAASNFVGGADADLLIDSQLIDIKTTMFLTLRRETFDQLIGYYLLYLLSGTGNKNDVPLQTLSIYFSRYGYLHQIPIIDIIDPEAIAPILQRFVAMVCPSIEKRRLFCNKFIFPGSNQW